MDWPFKLKPLDYALDVTGQNNRYKWKNNGKNIWKLFM